MDRISQPGLKPTTLEALGDYWFYAVIPVQAEDDDSCLAFPDLVSAVTNMSQ